MKTIQTTDDISNLLNIKYPIIQGAMAWIANSSLAAAVSNGGGLGIIAAGNAEPDWVRNQIIKTRELTDKPFGVNIMLLSPTASDIIDLVCEEKVPIVTTGAGNPGKYMDQFKSNGIKVMPVVANVALAVRCARIGADAIIAEGQEAGGHIGETTTMAMVPQIVDSVDVPVIAAGGIADGRGLAASIMLGAQGAQIGTRFVVADECTVADEYKEMILKAKDTSTTATGRSTGHPVRVIKNRLTKEVLAMEANNATPEEIDKHCEGCLKAAVVDGDVKYGSVMSGQIAGLVNKKQSAKDIIEEIMKEATEVYESRSDFFRSRRSISRDGV